MLIEHQFEHKRNDLVLRPVGTSLSEAPGTMRAMTGEHASENGELWSVTATHPAHGAVVGPVVMAGVHSRAQCAPFPCWLHAPSDHPMRAWPTVVRGDKLLLAERACPHGVGHPDPDSLGYFARANPEVVDRLAEHACDGCCRGAGPADKVAPPA